MILDFKAYIAEKMSVLERELYTEIDEKDTSRIIRDFMNHISKFPDDDYEAVEPLFNDTVRITYKPTTPYANPGGKTENGKITIFKLLDDDNYLDVKYTLVHELVHLIRQILSENERPYEDLDDMGKIRYLLLRGELENMFKSNKFHFLPYLLYIEDKNEMCAKNQNAYMWSFRLKKDNPDYTNQKIVKSVLKKLKLDRDHLKLALNEVDRESDVFKFIVYFLVGNFSEIGKTGYQHYFDNHIFRIPIVKNMKGKVGIIVKSEKRLSRKIDKINQLVDEYYEKLKIYEQDIITSFKDNVIYWFDESVKRTGKAIQLGIDDATENMSN